MADTRYDEAYEYAQDSGTSVTLGSTRTTKWFTPTAFAGFVIGYDHRDAEIGGDSYKDSLELLWSDFQEMLNE
jgi:hypothetical protein